MNLNNLEKTEKIKYLFDSLEWEIHDCICKVLANSNIEHKCSALILNNIMIHYIEIRDIFKMIHLDDVKDLFISLDFSRSEFRAFEKKIKKEWKYYNADKQSLSNVDKIKYVVNFLISEYISEVLEDSCVDPEYSAVTLNNEIICYLELIDVLNIDLPRNVKDLFMALGYSESEFDIFEEKRKIESEYYTCKQYTEE